MHPAENFGKHLKEARERKGISQTQLSTICAVQQSRISRIENNQEIPTPELKAKIEKALDTVLPPPPADAAENDDEKQQETSPEKSNGKQHHAPPDNAINNAIDAATHQLIKDLQAVIEREDLILAAVRKIELDAASIFQERASLVHYENELQKLEDTLVTDVSEAIDEMLSLS